MAQNKDISHLIERLEAFEDRLGVSFEGLYASVLPGIDFLQVNGELHPREGTGLDDDIDIVVSIHDSAGRVLGVQTESIIADSFFGFEAFSRTFGPIEDPSIVKIRIYPKAR